MTTGAIRAVIFDFDGTILDTEGPEYEAYRSVFADHGCELSVEEWAVCIGTREALDPHALLRERSVGDCVGPEELRRLASERKLATVEAAAILPGIEQWFDDAETAGLKIAVASSSTTPWVTGHLARLGLDHRLGCIVSFDGSRPPKPDPAPYLEACRLLGVDPSEAIAVEDSHPGVTAATTAGLFCVAVPHGLTRHLDLSAADVILDSLADLPLARALDLAARRP